MVRRVHLSLGIGFRLVMAALCLLPLANPRAVAGLSQSPLNSSRLPSAPVEEEDDFSRTDSEQRDAEHRTERRQISRPATDRPSIPASVRLGRSLRLVRILVPEDPFRNGLGTPYRC